MPLFVTTHGIIHQIAPASDHVSQGKNYTGIENIELLEHLMFHPLTCLNLGKTIEQSLGI